jgi:hypothetical protein
MGVDANSPEGRLPGPRWSACGLPCRHFSNGLARVLLGLLVGKAPNDNRFCYAEEGEREPFPASSVCEQRHYIAIGFTLETFSRGPTLRRRFYLPPKLLSASSSRFMEPASSKIPPAPVHLSGSRKGEELSLNRTEPGRSRGRTPYRNSRDSTSIRAKDRAPIDPRMPNIPPA